MSKRNNSATEDGHKTVSTLKERSSSAGGEKPRDRALLADLSNNAPRYHSSSVT